MKSFFSLALTALIVLGCSEESKVKNVALGVAKDRLEKKVRAEAEEKVTGKVSLVKVYVHTIAQRSEFEVETVAVTPPTATVFVKIRTLPKPVRVAMVDILARLSASKEHAFNVSDAIQETLKVMNMSSEERTETKERIELRDRDGWQALPDAS